MLASNAREQNGSRFVANAHCILNGFLLNVGCHSVCKTYHYIILFLSKSHFLEAATGGVL